MSFADYQSFSDPIKLPIGGKIYALPEVPASLGVQLRLVAERQAEILQIAAENQQALDEAEKEGKKAPEPKPLPDPLPEGITDESANPRVMLGKVYDEMVADGVPAAAMELATTTVATDFFYGRVAAEACWNSGGDPKAIARSLPGANLFSSSTDEASTTKKPASTSGTKPRKKK